MQNTEKNTGEIIQGQFPYFSIKTYVMGSH